MVMFDVCVGIAVVAGVCVGAIVRFCDSEDNWGLVSMSFPSCVEFELPDGNVPQAFQR